MSHESAGRESVGRLVRPRLHRPVPSLPPTLDTIVAIPTGAGENGAKARERYRSRIVRVLRMDDLRPQPGRSPRFEGHEHGASVSFFVVDLPEGRGPGPHRHPYEETFVILSGSASFTVDGETVEAGTGTIVVVPAGAVHGFAAGRDGMRSVNIHGSPRMEQVDLPPP